MTDRAVKWAEMTAERLRAKAAEDAVVIVPVASLEQHGPHLPTATDTLLGEETAVRAARLASARQPTLVLPVVWTGLSEHHMRLGGTITLDFDAFLAVLRGVVGSLKRQGFRRILLLNSHGGNIAALRTVTEELTRDFDMPIVTTTIWRVAQDEIDAVLEAQSGIRHACEGETSMMLAIRPDLVDPSRYAEARNIDESREAAGRPDDIYRWRSFADTTPVGVIGDPTLATAEKGERLFEIAAKRLADLITDEAFWG